MSNSKMLIDASHPEETRVVVLKGHRVEEFDFEAANKKQLRGNIYLAKVTRVEPSLQAAFVEYGGNRHGFLAFSEIHPDYYQIPFADRQALVEEEARAHRDEEEESRIQDARASGGESRGEPRGGAEQRNGTEQRGGGDGRGGRNERGGRGDRAERGDRGQRRSRRHRRDGAASLDRRGPADDSLSEPAFGSADGDVAAIGGDVPDAVERTSEPGTLAESAYDAASEPVIGGVEGAPTAEADLVRDDADRAESVEAPDRHDALPDGAAAGPATADISAPAAFVAEVAGGPPHAPGADTPDAESESAAPAVLADDDARAELPPTGTDEAEADAPDLDAPDSDAGSVGHDAVHPDDLSAPVEAHDIAPADDQADDDHHPHEDEHVEQIGGDALSDVVPRPARLRRHYKIQEVIKRRQILLIQVVKEERGNKGAALTTYLSLAGRYSVLMPNTAKGGGISRKITDGEDRKRLKAIAQELDVPEGMGVILRTAGAARAPIEVRRDFEYLLRMWESVRELTLKSTAPSLVYEEGSLIKRSIRDLYGKEVEEIVVAGEAGFDEARDFMRMLMPGNVKSVVPYRDPTPIFAKAGVEAQLDAMFSPHVTLKSGGYLVINQTEALVAIDVNSGRSTREHNIEDTALRTNLEAADEVARQLRLRDLAGLIVVDFIDMDEGRNNRAVERRIKEALKNDRARIQIGRISHFGLLEMSRQRIRTGVLEGSTMACPHCAGAGTVRSTASIALHVLRLLEDALIKDASRDLIVRSRGEVALYMLNQKRTKLVELELRFGVTIAVVADPALTGMLYHAIERGELATPAIAPAPRQDLVRVDSIAPIHDVEDTADDEAPEAADEAGMDAEKPETVGSDETTADGGEGRRRKRRRRRRGRERDGGDGAAEAAALPDPGFAAGDEDEAGATSEMPEEPEVEDGEDAPAFVSSLVEAPARTVADASDAAVADLAGEAVAGEVVAEEPVAEEAVEGGVEEDAPPAIEEAPRRRRSRRTAVPADQQAEVVAAPEETPARPRRRRVSRARAAEAEPVVAIEENVTSDVAVGGIAEAAAGAPATAEPALPLVDTAPVADSPAAAAAPLEEAVEPEAAPAAPDPDRPKRSGWWQRAKASFGP